MKEDRNMQLNYPGTIVKEFCKDRVSRRKSEGAFYRAENGVIYFVFSHYRQNREDGGACDLALSVSHDNGRTFSKEKVVLTCEQCGAENIMSVSLLKMQDGTIGVFYLKKQGRVDCRMYMRRTKDFVRFSDEVPVISRSGFSVVNNDRVVRLKDGAILVPSAFCDTGAVGEGVNHKNLHERMLPPAIAVFWRSEDDGKSFFAAGECRMPFEIFSTGLQEPGVVELEDARLLAFFRNNSGRQFISFSKDGGFAWSQPEPSVFTGPPSPLCMKKLSDGSLFAVYNPVPLYYGRSETVGQTHAWTGARTPLVVATGDGNAKQFRIESCLESDEDRGFCYCAISELDDAILLAYCAGGEEDESTLTRTRIRRIEKTDPIRAKEDDRV